MQQALHFPLAQHLLGCGGWLLITAANGRGAEGQLADLDFVYVFVFFCFFVGRVLEKRLSGSCFPQHL